MRSIDEQLVPMKHNDKPLQSFEETNTDDKIMRLYVTLKDLRRDLGYSIRRTYALERKIQAMENHQHGTNGECMIKIKDTYHAEGGDTCSAQPDVLA